MIRAAALASGDGVKLQAILDAMLTSAREKCEIKIDIPEI